MSKIFNISKIFKNWFPKYLKNFKISKKLFEHGFLKRSKISFKTVTDRAISALFWTL